MTITLVVALALTVLGDALAEMVQAPVPGAAIGMICLAALFIARGGVDPHSGRLFDLAAPHFSLFFIPAAVGVVASFDVLADAWFYVAVAIVLGTAATIMITGTLAERMLGADRSNSGSQPVRQEVDR